MSKVFCIGNGTSRKGFDLNRLKEHGKVYACNAIYREWTPDVLVAVDHGIGHEIYHSGYCDNNVAWFRNWTKVPAMMYESLLYAGLDKVDIDLAKKEWDGLYENERGDATEFVMDGTNLSGIVSIIRKDKSKYKEKINKSFCYISWQKEGDHAKAIADIMPKNQDLGWACGPMSGYIAIHEEKPKEVYLIGHDLKSNNNKVNNMYAGTKNYVTKEHVPTPHVNWVNQWHQLMTWNPDVQFYKVNPSEGAVSESIEEWQEFVGKNLTYIGYPTLDNLLKK